MATKRTKRIDPNAAFNAIMGISPPPEDAPEKAADATKEITADGVGETSPKAAPLSAAAQTPAPATEEPPKASSNAVPEAKKLVQKGYYLTEEQVRQLGILAVMEGVDRSSIVRNALEQYFAAQKGMSL